VNYVPVGRFYFRHRNWDNRHQQPQGLGPESWKYAHVLHDQGDSHVDYIERITYLLFLKQLTRQNLDDFARGVL